MTRAMPIPVLSEPFKKSLYRQHRTVVTIWAAFFLALGFYLLIPEFLSEHLLRPVDEACVEQLGNLLWAIAVAIAALLFWVKSRLHTVPAIFQASKQPTEVRNFKGESPMEKNAMRLVSFYRTRMISAFALSHIIAIFGLVVGLLSYHRSNQQGLSLLSACLLVYFFPSQGFFDDLIAEYLRREAQRS